MRKILTLCLCTAVCLQTWSQTKFYCLENDAVHRFLTEVDYSDDVNYTYTKITDYCDEVPYNYTYRKDQPNPVPLQWNKKVSLKNQRIEVSEDSLFSNYLTYTVDKEANAYDIYNLIPGRRYYYRVMGTKSDNSVTMLDSACFNTTGTLRMLKIDGIFNVRDMGGWTGLGGHKIRYGVLFRGSRMTSNGSAQAMITNAGKQAMLDAGIKADLDLRTAQERNLSASPLGSTVSYYYINDAYTSRIATFAKSDASIRGIKYIIARLKEDKPVYFHCSVGADRTGSIAFLIGALCGMSEDQLAKEFELTSFSADYVITNGKAEDLRRRRTYDGRYDSSEEDYKYALMIERAKAMTGQILQRKIYNHLKNGIGSGETIPEEDLDWLIEYLVDYKIVKEVIADRNQKRKGLTMDPGNQTQLILSYSPADATAQGFEYESMDENVATVDANGLVTAVAGGTTYVLATIDGLSTSYKVTVSGPAASAPQIPAQAGQEPIYNMAGQELYAPAGIFILNGRKYINK